MDQSPEDDLVHLPGSGATLLIAYGTTAAIALEARDHNPALGVLIVQKLAPCDTLPLDPVIAQYQRAVVIEDHFPHSGLYASLCRQAINNGWRIALDSAAPQQYSLSVSPTEAGYFRRFGMTAASLVP